MSVPVHSAVVLQLVVQRAIQWSGSALEMFVSHRITSKQTINMHMYVYQSFPFAIPFLLFPAHAIHSNVG